MKDYSIIIPIYNEDENLNSLIKEINFSLEELRKSYNFEIIIINDGSTDNSLDTISKLKLSYKIKVLNNSRNFGQSYSLYIGIKNAKYENIITLDGDLQNDPLDIKKLISIYSNSNVYKLVGGIRAKRKDTLVKVLSSRIANGIRKLILKDKCDDTGCSLKIFSKKIFIKFPYFDGMHRFLPALFSGYGYKTTFVNVNHRHRHRGVSKYGVYNRVFRGIRDIFKVKSIIHNYNKNND